MRAFWMPFKNIYDTLLSLPPSPLSPSLSSLSFPPFLSLSSPSHQVSQLESQLAAASEKLNTSLTEQHRVGVKVEAAEKKAIETEETLKREQVRRMHDTYMYIFLHCIARKFFCNVIR